MNGGLEQFYIWFGVCLASFTAYSYIRVVESWGKVSPQKRIMEPSTAFAGLLAWISMIANDLMYGDFGIGATIGLIAACLGIILIVMAVFHVPPKRGEVGPEHKKLSFPSSGIYAYLRHPLNDGLVLTFIGFPLAAGAVYSLFAAVLWALFVVFWGMLEDQMLAEEHGSEFIDYQARTFF